MPHRPVMLGVVGDSAAGKTTISAGIAEILGAEHVTVICVDDYHKYNRAQRKERNITPLHPDCNFIDIMEQHVEALADGEPILKPVYNHTRGDFDPPEYIRPKRSTRNWSAASTTPRTSSGHRSSGPTSWCASIRRRNRRTTNA